MKIALVSLNQKWKDKESNQKKVTQILQTIHSKGVDMVVFPEMTLTGFTLHTDEMAENYDSSPSIAFFKQCALKFETAIVFGIILKEKEKATNTLLVMDSNGEEIAKYHKIHPFSYAGEHLKYQAGAEIVSAKIGDAQIGLSICYDLRFPELFQILSKNCHLIINIANWPEKRIQHWQCLLQARAIENQVFFAGVNRIGTDGNGLNYVKSSALYNPQGVLLTPESLSEEIDIYNLDLTEVESYQREFPVKNDRQVELYKKEL